MGFAELLAAYGENYLAALLATWSMTVVCFVLALAIGVAVTVMRVCPMRPLRLVGDLYVQVFRNIPGVALLIIVAYALPYLDVLLDWRSCVVVAVVLLGSSFASENLMSGINTIGVGQIEAARSLGLTFTQMLRHVVVPQALRTSVLPMTNLLIAVMLTTALGSQVPMTPQELTGVVDYIGTRATTSGLAAFVVSAVCYVGTALVIGWAGNRLDRRVRILR